MRNSVKIPTVKRHLLDCAFDKTISGSYVWIVGNFFYLFKEVANLVKKDCKLSTRVNYVPSMVLTINLLYLTYYRISLIRFSRGLFYTSFVNL